MSTGNGKPPVLTGSLLLAALSLDLPLHESWQGEQEEPEDLNNLLRGAGSHLPVVISLHLGSLTGFAAGDTSRFPGGALWQQLLLPEELHKAIYPESL